MADVTCFNYDKVERLKSALDRVDVETISEAFKAVGHSRRMEVLLLINAETECCVCDLSNAFDCPVPTVSQYLKILRSAGLISSRVDGKFMHYSLTDFGKQLVGLVTP